MTVTKTKKGHKASLPAADPAEQDETDGLAMASAALGNMSPEELMALLYDAYEDDDSDDDDEPVAGTPETPAAEPTKSFADAGIERFTHMGNAATSGIGRRVKYVHTRPVASGHEGINKGHVLGALAGVTAAGLAYKDIKEAHGRGINSSNARTRIRTRAASQIVKSGITHSTRPEITMALDYKRERLKGVGMMGHRNALNASHYLNHHKEAVSALAKKHGVSERAVAHAMSYTAAKNFKRSRIFGKQSSEANRLYHARVGHQTVREAQGW